MSIPSIPKKQTVPRVPQALGQVNLSIPKASTVPPVSEVTTSVPKSSTVPSPTQAQQPFTFSAVPKPPETPKYTNPQLADWSTKQNELFSQMEQAMKTPFTYDPNTDAALQSQKALYEAGAAKASQSAMETMNDRGILGSSITGNQLAQIQQDANTQFNALIPQYQQQAYNQYQNNLAQIGQALSQAMNLRNQQFNEATTEAQLTGTYMPAGAQELVNSLYGLKSQAETRGITAQERAQLSTQADQIRSQLTAMGVDVSGVGADTSLANSRVGQRTLAGQQLDYAQQSDLRDYNESVRQYDQNFGYQQGRDQVGDNQWQQQFDYGQQRDQVADEQWMQEFNERVRQFGMNNALDWANHSISQQNANVNAGQLALSRDRFNYEKTQDSQRSSSTGSSSSSSSQNKLSSKESYNNYSVLLDDMQQVGSKAKARQLLELNADFLSDSDYRKLADYVNKMEG